MVNENQEAVQAPLPEMGGNEFTTEENPIIGEIDRLNTSGDDPSPPAESAPPEAEASTIEAPPAPEPVLTDALPPQQAPPLQQPPPDYEQLQQQASQYQQVQQRAAVQQEAQRYQQQLEAQGYLPDQATQLASQFMQSRQQTLDMIRQNEQQVQEVMGKQAAAEHFAKMYKLDFNDMATLRLSQDPQQMEQVAKKIADDRKVRDELAQLRKAQVPPQQFDNSQGAPEVAANDGSWLDRYNAGDRSSNAVSAAKKVLGIE